MKNKHTRPALCAGFLVSAALARAAVQTLPTPTPGGFADAESAAVVSLASWRDYLPQVELTLELNGSATNAAQVAFGRDLNGDADLQPEETEYVLGFDCGEWFTRDEQLDCTSQPITGQPAQSPRVSHTFTLKLAKAPGDRWDLAKVTTRGKADSQTVISAALLKPHFYIVIR